MFRQLVVLAVLAVAALSAPIEKFEDIPEEYKALVPAEVAEHLKSITEEEKAVLKEIVKEHKTITNEEEFMTLLKEKSPSLHEKALKLHTLIKARVDALGEEAKTFVTKVLAEGRQLHRNYLAGNKPSLPELKEKVKAQLTAYEGLSAEAKEQFKAQFPILTGVFQTLIPAEVAEHLKSITEEEKAVLKELVKEHKTITNEEEFMTLLKEKSPSLHEKALKLHTLIKARVDALGEEAKTFVTKVLAEGRQLHRNYLAGNKPSLPELKEKVKAQLTAYEGLSAEAKEQFKAQFPILTGVFQNEKIQSLIKTHIN